MHESFWKYKQVTRLECLSKELVCRVNKSNLKGAIKEKQELSWAGMVWGGLTEPDGYCRIAYETLWSLRAGNSAMLALVTLKAVGRGAWIRILMPVNVKKLLSTLVTLGWTIKSEVISGSPAITVWKIVWISIHA